MHNNSFFKAFLVVVSVSFFVSCDKDYSEIGDAIIGENNFSLGIDSLSTVQATWKKIGPIASNNLDFNSLGVLDNTAFGQTTAHFATQVQLLSINPTIDSNLSQVVESATLYIPYFPKKTTANADGSSIYTLDSIYGNKTSKIKLRIYENKYLLGNENTEGFPAPILDSSYPQFYYTNQNTLFDNDNKRGVLLYEDSTFIFSEKEFVDKVAATTTTAAITTYVPPGMRLDLNKEFFQKLLFDKSRDGYSLATNPEFERYFKGLYFNVEKADVSGVLARMNFKKGTIVIKYKEKTSSTDAALVDKSITLNLTGNTVNLLNNEPSTGVDLYSSPKADRLYLRGGEGSVATIDLFNPSVDIVTYNRTSKEIELDKKNGIPDELDYIKKKGWLVNEASLTFYIDQSLMTGVVEPSTIFLYDINNQKVLSVGAIKKDATGRGLKYKVVITDYVRGLLNNDNINVKLGVSVAQMTSNIKFKKTKDAPVFSIWKELSVTDQNAFFYPESSVMSPLGTILHGSNSTNGSKRLKLEIYYTKPN
jgi:hypothetical protein